MATKRATDEVKQIGRYIVADPKICHGKLTIRGTRILLADVLDQVERGWDWDMIVRTWGGKFPREAIAEAVRLANQSFLATATEFTPPAVRRKAS